MSAAPRPSRWGWAPRLVICVLLAGFVAVLAWSVLAKADRGGLNTRIQNGERPPAPSFDLPVIWPRAAPWPEGLAGAAADHRLTLAELRGRPVVLNFWASWCVPCQDEAPILADAARRHPEVRVVGVDVQDLTDGAIAFLRRFHTPYGSVHDADSGIYDDYGLTGVPETFYLDAAGRLVAHDPGQVEPADLERGIAATRSSP